MRPVTRRGSGDPVVLLHGFTQTQRSWDPLASELAARHQVLTLDAPGHGGAAGWAAGLWEGAQGIARAAGRAAYVGYSMGGRFALHVALAYPELVSALVVISTSAGIEDPGQRAARRRHDETLAQRVEAEGVGPFIAWWLAQPMWATLPAAAAGAAERLANTAGGLASSLRLAGAGVQEPLWDRLGELTMPVLAVAGELDVRYCAAAQRLGQMAPQAEVAIIREAGHACHLERPAQVLAVVEAWLSRARPPGPEPAAG